ncbi:transketolase [Spiroplasma platyhelix]|uniref:Transketolase n=1 Tax=Spiroplasma platyhelix PALS-1 TaxID=1276218 RepID=A0A846U1J8_9MOLU|nr:transketolase [Spiroplasma platyhelix]MBE4704018.1 Transketolase [Spiroplasma platyhelix PALS-1]NKE38389.1 transketolase [Spiroplasma platyhelix PALS-1]UJB29276.1 transketolase [Spiroplasma platyhelix PALS-1]
MAKNIDQLTINSIRMLGIQAVNAANSGHPGIVLGAAPMAYALFKDHLKFNPKNPRWFNRDRFVLSAGHGSALLYSMLYHVGYNYKMQDLKDFRQLDSVTPGHPEYDLDLGVEMATGPLGQGLATAVGMALAESFLAAKYNQENQKIIDHYTYVLCGDGDLQEGIAQEALSFAGHFKLNKLIVLYDSNDVQLDSKTELVFSENIASRFKAVEWNYLKVSDGTNYQAISEAIAKAKQSDKPTLIEVKTVIGYGATKQGTPAVHGAPLMNDIATVQKFLEWESDEEFFVPEAVLNHIQKPKIDEGQELEKKWNVSVKEYQSKYPNLYQDIASALQGETFGHNFLFNKIDWTSIISNEAMATRVASGKVLKLLSNQYPTLIGGSADLAGSTKAMVFDQDYTKDNPSGRHIHFGVREFAMAAMVNGLTLHQGVIGFGSTFLVFSDYQKPALRLAALMKIPSLFIFTHDSIAVGEDGPTHEPVEHLLMLRTILNFNLIRPADLKETIGAYKVALTAKDYPNAIVLTRQDLPQLAASTIDAVSKGAYIISQETAESKLDLVLIATGSEVHLAIEVQKMLRKDKINARVVSMPSTYLFDQQDEKYRAEILPKDVVRVAVELAVSDSWYKYVGLEGLIIGVNKYGASGNLQAILDKYGFTSEKIYRKVLDYIKNNQKNKEVK